MKNILITIALLYTLTDYVAAQEKIQLYDGPIPNSKEVDINEADYNQNPAFLRLVITPELEAFLPEKEVATGDAVIICPGGGYSVIVYGGEGVSTAKALQKKGIAAFVLKYRLPVDSLLDNKTIGPLQDAQQAIKVVRENAEKWGVNKDKIGIMGFSAGGHLASTAATHFENPVIENKENTSVRPDFAILVYPVISMQDSLTHMGSRIALLGDKPSKELVDLYSNELQVTENTPPTYITHAGDDKLVDVENSLSFYKSLNKNNVPAEMHIYPKGDHGFVLRQPVEDWTSLVVKWIKSL